MAYYVTKNIVLGTDGKYHWNYKFNMLKNPTLLFILWKIFFWILIGIFSMLTLFDIFGGHYTLEKFLEFWKFAFIFILCAGFFVTIVYFIYSLNMGCSYYVMFDMSDQGVVHTQMPMQFKKAQSMSSEWDKVKSIEIYRRRGVIKIYSLLNYNHVYAEPEDFEFVENFIKSHVSDKCKIK